MLLADVVQRPCVFFQHFSVLLIELVVIEFAVTGKTGIGLAEFLMRRGSPLLGPFGSILSLAPDSIMRGRILGRVPGRSLFEALTEFLHSQRLDSIKVLFHHTANFFFLSSFSMLAGLLLCQKHALRFVRSFFKTESDAMSRMSVRCLKRAAARERNHPELSQSRCNF